MVIIVGRKGTEIEYIHASRATKYWRYIKIYVSIYDFLGKNTHACLVYIKKHAQ